MLEHAWTVYTRLSFPERNEFVKGVFASLSDEQQKELERHAWKFRNDVAKGVGTVSYLEFILVLYLHPKVRAYLKKALSELPRTCGDSIS